jgi:hypothetical protein
MRGRWPIGLAAVGLLAMAAVVTARRAVEGSSRTIAEGTVGTLVSIVDSLTGGAARPGGLLVLGTDTLAVLPGVARFSVMEAGRPRDAVVFEGSWNGRAFYLPPVPDSTAAVLVDSSAERIRLRLAPLDSARAAGRLAGLVVLHRPERELKLFR